MPIHHRIDSELGLVEVVLTGELGDADLRESNERLRRDPAFRPDYSQIVEVRDADGSKVTSRTIRELAKCDPLFAPGTRRAVIVATELGFGMARMFQTLRDDRAGEIRVFREVAEARAWLGLDRGTPPPE